MRPREQPGRPLSQMPSETKGGLQTLPETPKIKYETPTIKEYLFDYYLKFSLYYETIQLNKLTIVGNI